MQKLFFILILSLILPFISQAQGNSCGKHSSKSGLICQTTIELLRSKGFQCEGMVCKGKVPSYPEPVIVMIPNNYKANGKIHYHFHGHNNTGDEQREAFHFNKLNGDGDYLRFANEANFESLMVFPLSQGKCATFDRQINSLQDLEKINRDIESLVGRPLDQWSLSFHSGSDRLANRLLVNPEIDSKLKGVALFDTPFGSRPGIRAALLRWKDKRKPVFRSFYAPSGSPVNYNAELMQGLEANQFIKSPGASHMSIMSQGRMSSFFRLLD